MNNNYDCSNCARQGCIHRDAFRHLPKSKGGLGLCPGHIDAQQPEAEANAQMEKLIFNKGKFLETDFGKALKKCVVRLDSVVAGLWDYLRDSDERLKIQRQLDLCLAQWDVYQAAIQQFYGLKLCFTRTAKHFGVCTEDESFWLFKVERGAGNVQAEN